MTQTTNIPNNTPHKITEDNRGNVQHDITIPNAPPMIPNAPPMIPNAPPMIPNAPPMIPKAPPISFTPETPEEKEERRIRTELARQKKAVELAPKPVDPRELHNIALNEALERRRKKLEGGGRFNKRILKLL
jgi:hypothetical protein